jgi:hypothetical protein
MATKVSKNNPANRVISKTKMVTSIECENCKARCIKGEQYLKTLNRKKFGRGVVCSKV